MYVAISPWLTLCLFAHLLAVVVSAREQAGPGGAVLFPERGGEPAPLPQPAHSLLQLRAAVPVRRGSVGNGPRADHANPPRKAHRPPPPPGKPIFALNTSIVVFFRFFFVFY